MKKIYTLLLLVCLFSFTQNFKAQSNGIQIQTITSPSTGDQFNTVDSFDIVIRIKNVGPNRLITADQFRVNYSVGDGGPSSVAIDTLITVGGSSEMLVDQIRVYTIASDFKINGNNDYSTCVGISGTNEYPTNTEKNPTKCVTYTVSVPESELAIEKVFYSKGKINLSLSSSTNFDLEIFSITGRLVYSQKFNNTTKTSFDFDAPSNGFYFMKVKAKDGKTITNKFVVN